jgi:hypothetical protein
MTDEANDNSGLLDSVTVDDEQTTESQAQSIEHQQPEAEEKSAAERPDFWPEKFWNKDENAPDMEGMSKSYAELEKQFRAGKHKPPADGNYSLDGIENISDDDPVVQSYKGWAAKYGISQQAFSELASEIATMGGEKAEEVEYSIKKEREALGPNADAIISNMATWAKGLVQKGIWGKEDFDEFKVWGGTANGLKAMMKLRSTYEGRVPVASAPANDTPSKEELMAMVGNPEYKTNPSYRAKVEKLFQQAFPD